jgi:quercetin 2,3-dioxygenase
VSTLERSPQLTAAGGAADVSSGPTRQLFTGREVTLGSGTAVRRLLPNLGRRLVGAWCFVDHYGPDDIADAQGMAVPPHPHIGLQTVSWLLAGEVHHRDSLGNDQMIRPGELGLMTAGGGIAHAEHSPTPHPALLHGVQLWVALPDASRATPPSWAHHVAPSATAQPGMTTTLIVGDFDGMRSPAQTYSPIVGVDVLLAPTAAGLLPLDPHFEYAVLTMSGEADVDSVALVPGAMLYLGRGSREVRIQAATSARLLLLGGEPFGEQIVMWWNFVGRSGEEIAAAREGWLTHDRFGVVQGAGEPTPPPSLPPGNLKPGGAVRQR